MTPSNARVLVVDDEPTITSLIAKVLGDEGYTVLTAANGRDGCAIAEREQVHLALVDLVMQGMSGLDVLRQLKDTQPDTKVMIMTAFATAESAVEAMKEGALDYLIKPFSMDELKLQIRRALGEVALTKANVALRQEMTRRGINDEIIGESQALKEALQLVAKTANSTATILILGESGTGKELIAREVHRASPRHSCPFLVINCGAIPETLLERELFGHERGAFTGADATRPGLLEAASDGTLFLDEISDMPFSLQVKLLRVLEGHEFMRVGGTKPLRSHVRFVAATNRDLAGLVKEGKFREDLYYRLNVVTVKLPPLRERGDDVFLLAEHFLKTLGGEVGRPNCRLRAEAREHMCGYVWPGNIRELRNVLERAVLLCSGEELTSGELHLESPVAAGGGDIPALANLPIQEAKEQFERNYIERALRFHKGNVSKTAERIGIDRKNLEDKIKKYNLK